MPRRRSQREFCQVARRRLHREERFSARPSMPKAKRVDVMEIVIGRTRFQISRTATEIASPIQKASMKE